MSVVELVTDQLPVRAPFAFSPEVVMVEAPRGDASEEIRLISTRLLAREADMGLGAVALCGTAAEAGTTFMAVNLAVALANAGRRTLLIDANLRTPRVQRMITPLQPTAGLTAVLEGAATYEESVRHDVVENLSVLFAGSESSQSFRLLAGAPFSQLLAQALDEYDVVLLDTPPARSVADGRHVAGLAGSAIAVARKDRTLVNDMHGLIDELRSGGADVLGIVFNAFGR